MRTPVLAVLALSAVVPAFAEEPMGPPAVLVITREEIKPGKMGIHAKSAASYVSVASRVNASNYRIGMTAIAGDENTVMYVEPYGSFSAFEAARNDFDHALATNAALRTEMEAVDRQGDLHDSQRTGIYRYRADLSYRPSTAADVAKARYVTVQTTRVKPGHGTDYVEYIKRLKAAREKAGIDFHSTVFQILTGGAPNTFVAFYPSSSMKEWDDMVASNEANSSAIDAAMGGAEAARQHRMLLADSVAETTLATYAMTPEISRPTPQIIAADPAFWGAPAAAGGKALATKKETKKPEAKQ